MRNEEITPISISSSQIFVGFSSLKLTRSSNDTQQHRAVLDAIGGGSAIIVQLESRMRPERINRIFRFLVLNISGTVSGGSVN